MTTPLEGIRVLDLTRLLPGPYCSMMLADFGAEVIKIEEPGRGDYLRWMSADKVGDTGGNFLLINRNKKSIILNLKHSAGKEILYRMVKEADIVMEGYRPGVPKRIGVDYNTLKEINPAIIYCSVTGYGQDGPYVQAPGHDINYIGYAGILGMTGRPGEKPVIPGTQIADFTGGAMMAVIGILLALQARQRTGRGQFVDISMLDGTVPLAATLAGEYFPSGKIPRRGGTTFTGRYACYNIYQTKDGRYIALAAAEEHFWKNLCEYFRKEEYIQWQYINEKQEELSRFLQEQFLTRERDQWVAELADKDVCCTPVCDMAEVFADPQVRHRQMIFEMEHPRLGTIKQIGVPIKLSDTPAQIVSAPPDMGEHTEEVLKQFNYSAEEIASFRRDGII
ncbi:MAG: CoA transferase [Peptococcaceae bacterium]|nr:MAG: CoA transferase [Peptococcaceae bacterium]